MGLHCRDRARLMNSIHLGYPEDILSMTGLTGLMLLPSAWKAVATLHHIQLMIKTDTPIDFIIFF